MSLFERLKNKRYDLQEGIDDKGNITPNPGDKKIEKSIVRNYNKKQKQINQTNVTSSGRVKATSDILKSGSKVTTSQRQTADNVLGNLNRFFTDQPDSKTLKTKATGDEGQFKGRPKVTTGKGVNQAEVSKKAQEFTKKVNKERIIKQGNIFGGEDEVKPKRRVGSKTSRGTRTKTKTTTLPGQQKLKLGDVTQKTPKTRLSKSGEIVTDLRTVGRKPRTARKRPSNTKPPKPEKMVTVKDPVKGGFKEVGATTTQGRKVLKKKQFVSTAKLLDPTPKPKPSTTKPNLFSRIKNFVKGEPKIPGDYNLVRGTTDKPLSVTRKVYKGKLGAVRKFVDKLPRKYKLAGTALIATAAAVPSIKKAFAPKPEKKSYTVANKTLKLDTGKKNT